MNKGFVSPLLMFTPITFIIFQVDGKLPFNWFTEVDGEDCSINCKAYGCAGMSKFVKKCTIFSGRALFSSGFDGFMVEFLGFGIDRKFPLRSYEILGGRHG
jgi:hypothetical protein